MADGGRKTNFDKKIIKPFEIFEVAIISASVEDGDPTFCLPLLPR